MRCDAREFLRSPDAARTPRRGVERFTCDGCLEVDEAYRSSIAELKRRLRWAEIELEQRLRDRPEGEA